MLNGINVKFGNAERDRVVAEIELRVNSNVEIVLSTFNIFTLQSTTLAEVLINKTPLLVIEGVAPDNKGFIFLYNLIFNRVLLLLEPLPSLILVCHQR